MRFCVYFVVLFRVPEKSTWIKSLQDLSMFKPPAIGITEIRQWDIYSYVYYEINKNKK